MKIYLLRNYYALTKRLIRQLSLIWLLLICFVVNTFASELSQNSKITISLKEQKLIELIREIERQTEFLFVYNQTEVDVKVPVSVKAKEKQVADVLSEVFKNTSTTYIIEGNNIVLGKKASTKQQKKKGRKITGKVIDKTGGALPGVTITVLGSTRGVISDADGVYEITGISSTDKLVYSFIGMESQVVEVKQQSLINITLSDKVEELADVTVVAFGKQKKESVLSSITTVDVGELQVPTSNLTTALAGRMAGVISYQRSGEPGQDNAEFFIRGVTTFGYKKDPLILIDGIELSASDLSRLNPDDIQAFSIMKDATATALYGARGANGVILVTTKEGKEGKAKVSLRYEESFSMPTNEIELADPITYMNLFNEAVRTRNPLQPLPYSENKIGNTIKGTNQYVYPSNNWHDMLFKNYTENRRFNMNVSGGGKVAQYYVAASAKQDNGILKVDNRNNFNNNIKLNKYLLRANITMNVTKTTKMKVRMHGTFDDYTGPLDGGTTVYNKAMRTSPVDFPAYYLADEANQYTNHILFGNAGDGNYVNPYADMVKGYKDYSKTLLLTQVELEQNLDWITKGLRFRILGNTNRYSFFDVRRSYKPFFYQVGMYDRPNDSYVLSAFNPDEGTEYLDYSEGDKQINSSFYMESAVNYDKTFDEKHTVSGMLVYTMRESKKANQGNLQKSLAYRNLGISGRFTYSYDSRYFGEFNFGYNGSERFSAGERFGFFPSVGAGWYISNEPFWKPLEKVISKFKVKATYGLVGNDAIGSSDDRFFYLSNVNMDDKGKGMSFGDENGYYRRGVSISRYENADITWEIAKKANFGIELGLFEGLELQVDLFQEDRSNILMDRIIPADAGLQAKVRANVGKAQSKGVDLSLDYQHFFANDFWLTCRGNFTYATGKFKYVEEPDYSETPWLSKVGQPINQKWGYIAERLFVDEQEVNNSPEQTFGEYMAGDIKYRDVNGDGKISSLDMVPIGHPTTPEIVYGFGASVGYKNFDINCFFQGSARSSFWLDVSKTAPFIDYNDKDVSWDDKVMTNNALLQAYADNFWSEENRDMYALWPRLSPYNVSNNSQRNTWFMQDGSFLRLKTLEVGYSMPQNLIKRIGAERLRLYLSGSNLLCWSPFKLWDPEMAGNGFGYPVQRVFNLGVQVSF
ncbi:SusC/RagA family TonB-linked outer membrane protein [Prolixibacteraceae bacterium JC049]|nr:SusC/RagA family TonB-linked outer membrane protein [Prolixibacteraceae bacterium JC049]